MINEVILNIKQDKKLYEYLKYHSYWYKKITYSPEMIKDMIKEMKIELKDTVEDKLMDLNNKMKYVSSLISLLS